METTNNKTPEKIVKSVHELLETFRKKNLSFMERLTILELAKTTIYLQLNKEK